MSVSPILLEPDLPDGIPLGPHRRDAVRTFIHNDDFRQNPFPVGVQAEQETGKEFFGVVNNNRKRNQFFVR